MNLNGLCTAETVTPLLDAGLQPVSNRFLATRDEKEALFPMRIGQCRQSGIICLTTPFPAEELVPRHEWITYNEPEPHLDDAVAAVRRRLGIPADAVVGGISLKDDSTLARFARQGCRTWRLDMREDLGITHGGAGAESIQGALTVDRARVSARKNGKADLLVVRHMFEHVYDLPAFTDALRELCAPDGHILFEIPDCSRALDLGDYTTLWEEHLYYFTRDTFKVALGACGFHLVHFAEYPYPFENSLIAVVRPSDGRCTGLTDAILCSELARGAKFAAEFPDYGRRYRRFFAEHRRRHGKMALLGAGHLACTFIWLFRLQEYIECVIDDNPHKEGLYMPASRLPIVGSRALQDKDITLCLLSLNPLSEEKVVGNHPSFVARGGRFLSIFPASARSIHKAGLL